MGLLDQPHPGGAMGVAKMPRVRLMPLVARFLGSLAHVFGQHEVSVVEQTGLSRPVRNSPAEDGSVRALGLERQESAFLGLGREEVVAVIEEQGLEIRLAEVMHETCELGRWVHRRRGAEDGHEMEHEPDVHNPAPGSATFTLPGRGQTGHGKRGLRVGVHQMISHRQVARMPETAGKVASILPPRLESAVGRPQADSIRSVELVTVTEGCQ